MHPLVAALLGVVEGLTEFLPISSTGHLILVSKLLNLEQTEFLKTFEIAIQLGAILAVVVLYARSVLERPQVIAKVIAAFIPTAIIGFLLHDFVKAVLLESVPTVLWALFLGGIVLILFDLFHRERSGATDDLRHVTYTQAIIIGLFQSIALVPGVSRAAATIIGGQIMGLRRKTIIEFSFLLAIPTMAAATGLDLMKTAGSFTFADFMALAIGFVVSFVTAIIAVRWLLRFIQRHSFVTFGVYRMTVAIVMALLLLR
jgi:undecaprenyl-diphosphatase